MSKTSSIRQSVLIICAILLASCSRDTGSRPAAQAVRWIAGAPVAEANLLGVDLIDEKNGWAVGGTGLLLSTTNGGETWDLVPINRAEDLWSVKFLTRELGFIVGEDGLILATVDGGNEWAAQSSGTTRALLGLAVARDYAVAVGEKGTILRSEDRETWTPIESGTSETLNAVAASGDSCWAVGSKGVTVGSTDRGRSWTPSPTVVPRDLMSVSIASPLSAVAVGRRGGVQLLGPE